MNSSGDVLSPAESQSVIAAIEGRTGSAPAAASEEVVAPTRGVRYLKLKQTNPEYLGEYWSRLRALYAGGRRLLEDDALLSKIFPRHRDEHPSLYAERKRRSFYIPYAAEIIDHIVASLTAQPILMKLGNDGPEELPQFYKDFFKDVSPEGGKSVSFAQYLKEQVLDALICQSTWALVDLPVQQDYENLAEQEEGGALDSYLVRLAPEVVVDWEEDETGELEWVLLYTVQRKRPGIEGDRTHQVERWTYYTKTDWTVYELRRKPGEAVADDFIVPATKYGTHTFQRVPVLRMTVPDGLWAMNKLEGLAREHFNKRSGLSFAEFQSLLPELYEFLGPGEAGNGQVISETQEDPNRAFTQVRGQGFVQTRGKDDRAEFIGPDSAPFKHSMESCNNVRDEMHRVTHQMALSVDNSAAALGRSGDSKAQDKAATSVILTALGQIVREHAEEVMKLVSVARNEAATAEQWSATGMEKFDAVSVADSVTLATDMELVPIQSHTFQKLYKLGLAKIVLGEEATPEDIEEIEKELDTNITAESMAPIVEDPNGGMGAKKGGALTGGAKPKTGGFAKKPAAKPTKPPKPSAKPNA